jgi:predicted RNase H-like nuclease (RuvC/YqgF family)
MPLRDAEKQAPPQHPSKRRASEGSVPQQDDAQYWKNMFYSLQQQRVTEVEAQLYAFSEESEKREESLKAYIHHLETQVTELKETVQESQEKAKEMEGMQVTMEKQEKEIELHRILTGTTLSKVDATKQVSCDCSVTNPETKKSTSFRLTSTEGNEAGIMIKYEPVGKPDSSLPAFLHEAIEFDSSQTPALMQNVLKGMFPDED